MIGYILLILAILLYKSNRKVSILLFIFFAMNGLGLLRESFIGAKCLDLAFIYTVCISFYSSLFEGGVQYKSEKAVSRGVSLLFVFLLVSSLFSYFYYEFSPYQVVQGGRHLFVFISYYFLKKIRKDEVEWIIKSLFVITVFHAILYILQVLFSIPVLPSGEALIDASTGLRRYYNYPYLIPFYLFVSFLFPKYYVRKWTFISSTILLIALFCTLGRTFIIVTCIMLVVGMFLNIKPKYAVSAIVIFLLVALPFVGMITARMSNSSETDLDIEQVLNGDYKYSAMGVQQTGTLTYRFAWVHERLMYLADRPFGEIIFGLGMISDSQTNIVNKKYQFTVGLSDKEHGVYQLYTPDIAWGNFVTRFGAGGTILLLNIWLLFVVCLYKRRYQHPFYIIEILYVVELLFLSISESHISEPGNLVFPFVVLALANDYNRKEMTQFEKAKTRIERKWSNYYKTL